jgi:hypothetical protein
LKKSDKVVVTTDKTNSFKLLTTEEYIKQVKKHLTKSGMEIDADKLTEVKNKAEKLLGDLSTVLSEKEASFILQSINSKSNPLSKTADQRPQRSR